MRVEIHIHLQVVLLVLFLDGVLAGQDGWMLFLSWVFVFPVQVCTVGVEAPLASRNSIRVEDWNNLKHVVVE